MQLTWCIDAFLYIFDHIHMMSHSQNTQMLSKQFETYVFYVSSRLVDWVKQSTTKVLLIVE